MNENPKSQIPWKFIIAFLFVGPFAFPLFWRDPRYSRNVKWTVTLGMLGLTAVVILLSMDTIREGMRQYEEAKRLLEGQ